MYPLVICKSPFVPVYIYIYVLLWPFVPIYIYSYIYIYIYIYTYIYIYIHIYVCNNMSFCSSIYIDIDICVCVYLCMYYYVLCMSNSWANWPLPAFALIIDLFQELFRQDLLVASLFRNFLLAERIMRSYNCTPVSYPFLLPCYQHPMWHAWDLALDHIMAQLPALIEGKATYQVCMCVCTYIQTDISLFCTFIHA